MVKSLHRSLEAKLASIKDPEYSESEGEGEEEPETISAKRAGKGAVRKGKRKAAPKKDDDDDDEANQPSTVIYLGHLPVGFEERELTVFLNQFGAVKRCRVSRSTKTGRSRCYAFVDFADPEVTKIVAETMSGYFLLEKRLVCHVLPNDKVHEHMFTRPKRVPTKAEKQKKAMAEVNKHRSAEALKGITDRLVKREETKRKRLASLGIDYDFPGYAASAQTASQSNKKMRKVSDVDEEKDDKSTDKISETKTPKSKKKKTKTPKSKKRAVEESGEEEKENDVATNENDDVAEPVKSVKKKKKLSKTPKKAKTPKRS